MKKIQVFILFVAFAASVFAQENQDSIKNWSISGNISLNFSEASFSNWIAGGKNSVSGVGLFDLNANYSKGKDSWENTFHLGYGLQKEKDNDAIKSEDRIEINSKYGRKTKNEKILISGLLNFKSQMANGYNYPDTEDKISGLFAPAYINIATGIDYKPCDKLSFFVSPVSGKFTIVNDDDLSDAGAFGVDPGKKVRSEMGATFNAEVKTPVVPNVDLHSKINLFSNYFHNPQNIDVNWDVTVNMKINDFLSANLITNLIYDDDILIPLEDGRIGKRIQFKQLFGAGLSLKF